MKLIALTQGAFAIVDDADYPRLVQFKWHLHNCGYAGRNGCEGEKPYVLMHQEILGCAPNGMETDHVNQNKLDNRRVNLRHCALSLNRLNSKVRIDNSSGFKGVHFCNRRKHYVAQIRINGRCKYLGSYDDPTEASIVYGQVHSELCSKLALQPI